MINEKKRNKDYFRKKYRKKDKIIQNKENETSKQLVYEGQKGKKENSEKMKVMKKN